MSTDTSPLHRSHPPSQQVRPTASIRPRGLLPRWACAVLAACLALAVLAVGPHAPKADTSSITGDKDLAKQVINLLPDDYRARGIHVSVITTEGARHAGIGTAASGQQYTSTTPMEIGSITKTFTGQLLADAIARGEVKASDPLSTHLPELAGTPAGEATLEELASHRSGIPGVPSQDLTRFVLRGDILGLNPFTDSTDQLIEKTRTTEMGKRGEFAYSNLGISLLGEALRRAAGAESWKSYASERLFAPLGMEHTTLTADQSEIPDGAIHGVQANGRRGQSLSGPGSNPAGAGVWSTPEDMTRYAQALLTDGQKASSARLPVPTEMLLQGMILGIFTILALVMGLYTAARAASSPSRMTVICRVAALLACLAAAAASGPWAHVPTWILAVASLPGLYGIVRGITLWPDLPTLPRRRAWLGWTQVALTVAFVAVCLVVAWPKA